MVLSYKIQWTEEAIEGLESILLYLEIKWTKRAVENFKTKLSRTLKHILSNPNIFPFSEINSSLRKAVVNKNVTIFYKELNGIITIVFVFVNRQDPIRLK